MYPFITKTRTCKSCRFESGDPCHFGDLAERYHPCEHGVERDHPEFSFATLSRSEGSIGDTARQWLAAVVSDIRRRSFRNYHVMLAFEQDHFRGCE